MGKLSDARKTKEEIIQAAFSKNEVLLSSAGSDWHRAAVTAVDDTTMKYLVDMTEGKYAIDFGDFTITKNGYASLNTVVVFELESDMAMFKMFYEVRKGNGDKI